MSPPLRKQEIASMKHRSGCSGKCLPLGDESTLALAPTKFNDRLHVYKNRDTSRDETPRVNPEK